MGASQWPVRASRATARKDPHENQTAQSPPGAALVRHSPPRLRSWRCTSSWPRVCDRGGLPYKESVGAPTAGFTEIELAAEDGVTLKAWYAPATNGAAIILLHGAGGSREGVRDHATMLAENGYGVLALDMRGHGESGGTTNRFGGRARATSGQQSLSCASAKRAT